MQNPWDVAGTPDDGDQSEDITFASVGRALTRWEEFEMAFASIFSLCVTDARGIYSLPATRAYGSILAFQGRASMVKATVEAYLACASLDRPGLVPVDDLEVAFKGALKLSLHFSPRRNEIAHGYVRKWTNHMGDDFGYALFPSSHAANKHTIVKPDEPLYMRHSPEWPDYMYTSKEIDAYAAGFVELTTKTRAVWIRFLDTRFTSPV